LVLEGLLGCLCSIGEADNWPTISNLKDTQTVELSFGDYKGFALPPKLLTKECMVFVLAYPTKILLNITSFIREELSSLRVVRELNNL
jgi:hypothetical protein